MPLQLRRGNTTEINAIVPLIGEILYDTQTGNIHVGDGVTAGGVQVTNYTDSQAKAAAGAAISSGTHSGIGFTYDSVTKTINGTINLSGVDLGTINGSVAANNSTLLVDATNAELVGRINTAYDADFTGGFTIKIYSQTSVIGAGPSISHYHNSPDVTDFNFYRARGSLASPLPVQDVDDMADITGVGLAADGVSKARSASISFRVNGTPTATQVPGKIIFATNNGTSFANRGEIDATGEFKINSISAFTAGGTVQFNSLISGDISGSVFADDSTRILDGTNSRVTARSLQASQYMQFPVYATLAARNAAITAPTAGMVAFVTNNGSGLAKLQVYTGLAWADLN